VTDDLRTWVADTSSIIEIRQVGLSTSKQLAVFKSLTQLVAGGQLIFPPQLCEELEAGLSSHGQDRALVWARAARDKAERRADLETVRRVLSRAPKLIDADSSRDPADPYVIALALDNMSIGGVSILSDDRRDHPDGKGGTKKLSVATVAGLYGIPVVPLVGFILDFVDAP
jgi:hypothetical protein